MILYLIPVFTALTLLVAGAGIYQLRVRRRRVADRLQRVVDGVETREEALGTLDGSLPLGLRLVAVLAWLMPGQIYSETLHLELAQAGYRHLDARRVFVGVRAFSTAFLGLLATLISWQLHLQQLYETIGLTLLGAGIGYYLPLILLRMRASRRQQEIILTLPDALDLLVICVEAGQGLNAALLKVGRESAFKAKTLSQELMTVNNEMRAGVTRIEALRNLALRTGVTDVRALTAVMIQSDKLGSSIADALRIHAESLRIKRRQRAEEAARKAPVKLVFPLVLCIFPELLVVILAPGMLQLFRALSQVAKGG